MNVEEIGVRDRLVSTDELALPPLLPLLPLSTPDVATARVVEDNTAAGGGGEVVDVMETVVSAKAVEMLELVKPD